MHQAIFSTALGLALGLGVCGPAMAGDTIDLRCETDSPQGMALCDALRADLAQRGYGFRPEAGVQLVLIVHKQSRDSISASLDVIRGGDRRQGPTGELSVMDRDGLPPAQLRSFAAALVDTAKL